MLKSLNYKIKIHLSSTILKLVYGLNRKSVRGRENYLSSIKKGTPVIIAVWHGHLLSIVHDLRKEHVHAVAGTHKDADLISEIASRWGWNMIRGSSKEKGNIAYKKMIASLKMPGSILFITPDGPTGPRRIPKPGIIRAAQATNAIIIPTSVHSTKNWKFNNWDTFYLEKPFGKIYIEYGEPITYDKTMDQADCIKNFIKIMETTEKNNLQYTNNDKS